MEKEEVLFYHGKTSDGYRFTIAGRFQTMPINGDNKEVDVIILGASLCSENDNFEKKLGRMRAEGRMKSRGPKGRCYYPLYGELSPRNWFEGQEHNVFLEATKLNNVLSRNGFMSKFNL